ncbi:MAG: protein tyrosine phosphatase [Rhizobiaceae bacterium]
MIHVTPLSRLDDVVRSSGASHLVSLLTAGSAFTRPREIAAERHLHLTMHDIVAPIPGHTPPGAGHVATLLDFASSWDRSRPLVINCYAGISRSTAAAYVIACALAPERGEAALAVTLRQKSPSATPNPLIVSLGDAALGRDGRMSAAVAAIGRGADAYEGEPFSLEI